MPSWTHLVRFIAIEDSQEHLGQLIDTARDVGRDSVEGIEIAVYLIDGTLFDGRVTEQVLHVKTVSRCHQSFGAGINKDSVGCIAIIPGLQKRLQLY